MVLGRSLVPSLSKCRSYSTGHSPRAIPVLSQFSVESFRQQAFEPAVPTVLPRQHFAGLPAVRKWFISASDTKGSTGLNVSYLSKFGATIVPIEITNNGQFTRTQQSLSFFLECVRASESRSIAPSNRYFSSYVPGARAVKRAKQPNDDFFSSAAVATLTLPNIRAYLAQASLVDLPQALTKDVPTPELVLTVGKGDVYDSSLWLGEAPTYTPLHRDPNPNLFVQLAGRKVVRLFEPRVGLETFDRVQERIGGTASPTLRGEEMMQGTEREVLEDEVWGADAANIPNCWEAGLEAGDGIFIPKGWWHSIKGTGEGMTGSVSGLHALLVNIDVECLQPDLGELVVQMNEPKLRQSTLDSPGLLLAAHGSI